MDFAVIVDFIQNTATPLICLVGMFYLLTENNKSHKEQENKMVDAVTNNTLVIQKLCDMLDKEGVV